MMDEDNRPTRKPELIDSEALDQGAAGGVPTITGDEYLEAHGETLSNTLDLDTWHPGTDLIQLYARLQEEIAVAVKQETQQKKAIRERIFPYLQKRPDIPGSGVYTTSAAKLHDVHHKLLFNGAVEACDGTVVSHDTLPVTITQIGVCLVSYHGDQGSWVHRLYRRDLRAKGKDPLDDTIKLLDARKQRGAADQTGRDKLSTLARRGIMAYAERAVLLRRSNAIWRMGHGSPTPYELITGSGIPELLEASLKLLRELILGHEKFVFVPSAVKARELLTIGNALRPLEYAVVDTNQGSIEQILISGHYRGQWATLGNQVEKFAKEVGPKIAVGLFRVSDLSPAQLFYAHVDHVHTAALIAMADSLLQEHRGFPMLIDLADNLCRSAFGGDVFSATTQVAYSSAGAPYQYMPERSTR